MVTYVGIDPGLEGGIVAMLPDSAIVYMPMPVKKGRVNAKAIAEFFELLPKPMFAVVEQVGSRPDNGVVSMFTFGEGYGKVICALEILDIKYLEKTPRSWKDCVLANTKKDKDAAIAYCKQHYPTINLLLSNRKNAKEHDGIADAACIARYAELIHKHNPKILK